MNTVRNRDGFSLIELMVVLALLGMSLLVAAPNINGYLGTKRMERTFDDMSAHLDMARNLAVATNTPCEALFDTAYDNYRVFVDTNANGSIDTGERVIGPFDMPNNVDLETVSLAGDGRLVFQTSGVLGSGQGGSIIIKYDNGVRDTMEVYNSGSLSY